MLLPAQASGDPGGTFWGRVELPQAIPQISSWCGSFLFSFPFFPFPIFSPWAFPSWLDTSTRVLTPPPNACLLCLVTPWEVPISLGAAELGGAVGSWDEGWWDESGVGQVLGLSPCFLGSTTLWNHCWSVGRSWTTWSPNQRCWEHSPKPSTKRWVWRVISFLKELGMSGVSS